MMQNKCVRLKKTAILFAFVICFNAMLCGAKPAVEMDTETRIVYQCIGADTIFKDFASDEKTAKNKYDDGYYQLFGKVLTKSKNNKEITLGAMNGKATREITCKFSDKDDISFVSSISTGNIVRMYGKLSVGIRGGISFKANGLSKADSTLATDDAYSVWGGKIIKKSSMKKRTIEGSKVNIYIPSEWQAVEHNILNEKLGSINGYQYRLNEIGNKDAFAESFFVCYFDKNTGVDKNDKGDNKLIEEAILRDVLGQNDLKKKFPLRSVTTYYGPKYKYYRDSFKKETGEKYQVEAIFQEEGDGIIVYFYVYKDSKNINDIMVVLRLLSAS